MNQALINRREDFQQKLLVWFRQHARDLPWRRERNVYSIVVSEFMLQQTQVKTVLPYFERWMRRFPSFEELAAADEADVLKQWEGLGYYSRARNLHKLAKALAHRPVPGKAAAWIKLPGIGPYTSAAISSQAFGEPIAVVDGNVVRVLSRLTCDDTELSSGTQGQTVFGPLAQALLAEYAPGEQNEAVMELGATVCLKRKPLCTVCPLLEFCCAGRRGDAGNYPNIRRKKQTRRTIDRIFHRQNGSILLYKADSTSRRLQDLHELPTAEALGISADELSPQTLLATKRRGISNEIIQERIFRLQREGAPRRWPDSPQFVLVPLAELDNITLSGPHRRWIRELLD